MVLPEMWQANRLDRALRFPVSPPMQKGIDVTTDLNAEVRRLTAERDRLQLIIDSRPAINAGLPETYITWSQSIYVMDYSNALETKQ